MTHMANPPAGQPTPAGPPAGWYPHPEKAGSQGYWDGSAWTEHLAPLTPSNPSRAGQQPGEEAFGGLAVAGYVFAVLMPIIGGLIGFALLFRRPSSGVPILLVAVLSSAFWWLALAA